MNPFLTLLDSNECFASIEGWEINDGFHFLNEILLVLSNPEWKIQFNRSDPCKSRFWLLPIESHSASYLHSIIYYTFDMLLKCVYSQTRYNIKYYWPHFSFWIIQCAMDHGCFHYRSVVDSTNFPFSWVLNNFFINQIVSTRYPRRKSKHSSQTFVHWISFN